MTQLNASPQQSNQKVDYLQSQQDRRQNARPMENGEQRQPHGTQYGNRDVEENENSVPRCPDCTYTKPRTALRETNDAEREESWVTSHNLNDVKDAKLVGD